MHARGKDFVQRIALERIYRLFELAGKEFGKHPERAKRYVEIARALGKRNKVAIPQELKRRFCKGCGAFLKRGMNSDERVEGKLLLLECKECGKIRKLPKGGKA